MTDASDDLVIAAKRAFKRAFAGVIKIENEDKALWIDGHATPPTVAKNPPKNPDPLCVWGSASDTMHRVLEGERALESAYVSGRLKVSGDMSVMARIEMENIR